MFRLTVAKSFFDVAFTVGLKVKMPPIVAGAVFVPTVEKGSWRKR